MVQFPLGKGQSGGNNSNSFTKTGLGPGSVSYTETTPDSCKPLWITLKNTSEVHWAESPAVHMVVHFVGRKNGLVCDYSLVMVSWLALWSGTGKSRIGKLVRKISEY